MAWKCEGCGILNSERVLRCEECRTTRYDPEPMVTQKSPDPEAAEFVGARMVECFKAFIGPRYLLRADRYFRGMP